jgi:hypothetical protein
MPCYSVNIHRVCVPNAEFAAWLKKQKHPQFSYSLWGTNELRFHNVDHYYGLWKKNVNESFEMKRNGRITVSGSVLLRDFYERPQKADPWVAEVYCDPQSYFWQDVII